MNKVYKLKEYRIIYYISKDTAYYLPSPLIPKFKLVKHISKHKKYYSYMKELHFRQAWDYLRGLK